MGANHAGDDGRLERLTECRLDAGKPAKEAMGQSLYQAIANARQTYFIRGISVSSSPWIATSRAMSSCRTTATASQSGGDDFDESAIMGIIASER